MDGSGRCAMSAMGGEMTDRLQEIRAWREEVKANRSRFPIVMFGGIVIPDIEGEIIDYLLAEVERWKGLAVHHETLSDEARINLLIERAQCDKALAEVERLRGASDRISGLEQALNGDDGVLLRAALDGGGAPVMREPLRALTIKGARKEIAKRAALNEGGGS